VPAGQQKERRTLVRACEARVRPQGIPAPHLALFINVLIETTITCRVAMTNDRRKHQIPQQNGEVMYAWIDNW